VPNCNSFLVTEAERKHVRRSARFQQHRDASCHQVFFFPARQGPEGNSRILVETLREYAPSYATVKNWVAQFKRGDFSTCVAPRPERPKTVTTPEIIDQILEDRRVSSKSIAEQLSISRKRVGSIIHEDLDIRELSAKWAPKFLNADQNVKGASRLSNFWNFFGAIQIISCRARLVTMDEAWLYHYDPEAKQ